MLSSRWRSTSSSIVHRSMFLPWNFTTFDKTVCVFGFGAVKNPFKLGQRFGGWWCATFQYVIHRTASGLEVFRVEDVHFQLRWDVVGKRRCFWRNGQIRAPMTFCNLLATYWNQRELTLSRTLPLCLVCFWVTDSFWQPFYQLATKRW